MVPVIYIFFFLGGGGHTHFCPFCPNHESMAEFQPAMKNSLSWGGGGGGNSGNLLLPARPKCSSFYSSIGIGVYEMFGDVSAVRIMGALGVQKYYMMIINNEFIHS